MNTDELDFNSDGLVWDKPYFYLNGTVFEPRLIEASETLPLGFNTVILKLNGKTSSDLDWKEMENQAEEYKKQGYQLFWHLDLGLFNSLKSPLSNQTQFLSLMLSMEHFRDTLWKKFKECTLGVCLYQGTAQFSEEIRWDEQLQSNFFNWGKDIRGEQFNPNDLEFKSLFARDAIAEYLTLIANRMPDAMQLFMCIDITASMSLSQEAQMTHRERFDRFHLIVRKSRLPTLFNYRPTEIGICLPSYNLTDSSFYQELESVLQNLLEKKTPFRLIPEAFLIHEWEGLDSLIVEPSSLSTQGQRKLQGFCAAGGSLVTLEQALDLP